MREDGNFHYQIGVSVYLPEKVRQGFKKSENGKQEVLAGH